MTLLGAIVLVGGGVLVWYTHRPLPEAVTAQALFQGVTFTREVRDYPRPLVIDVVQIDLTAPGVTLFVSPPEPRDGYDLPARTVSQFVADFGLQVGINAHYFQPWRTTGPWDYYPHPGDPVSVNGLAMSDGVAYGEARPDYPEIQFSRDNRVSVGTPLDAPYNVVAGNSHLVTGGRITVNVIGDDYLGEPQPRSAVGVDATGTLLTLMVVDGRQPGYSEGVTAPELAALLLQFGVAEGLNLDGGGSATLVVQGPDGTPRVLNSPIDQRLPGRERPVAASLGVRALPLDAVSR